ncbi:MULTISPECIES: DUF4144 family protein [Vibrio]|uniref:Uncharacterized protein n=1 Tax=Vibrio casei TaxID=673372 RepID=A0A368LNG6_9VIBR|nr:MULTISPECIES: DUF4144 family protein [Vibrio]RCS73439.1 hypothetical protein CIK83_07290 [Vibrio casei]SJN24843.1 hypothetical protein FM109_05745 [Vibrio casei]HBV77399.1 hypothetical protein [Vibrio sp.]
MINWPCMLKLEGDDELIYLNSEKELNGECEGLIWDQEDRVIDSKGFVYSMMTKNSVIRLQHDQIQISVEDASKLIQSHEFCRAEVCLTKIQFDSVFEAVKSLE